LIDPDYSQRNLVAGKAKVEYQLRRPEGFRDVASDISSSYKGMPSANAAHDHILKLFDRPQI
jgi:hypothetical protein